MSVLASEVDDRKREAGGGRGSVNAVVTRVRPTSVLRFSVLLYVSVWVILLVAGICLWLAASVLGVRANVESLAADLFASETFSFKSMQMLRASLLGGAAIVGLGTVANVVLAVLYNLISDLVGGVRVVLQEVPPEGGAHAA